MHKENQEAQLIASLKGLSVKDAINFADRSLTLFSSEANTNDEFRSMSTISSLVSFKVGKISIHLGEYDRNVKNAATGTYHAVSGKHLPRYLAEFNNRFNRRYDLAKPCCQHQATLQQEHRQCRGVYSS